MPSPPYDVATGEKEQKTDTGDNALDSQSPAQQQEWTPLVSSKLSSNETPLDATGGTLAADGLSQLPNGKSNEANASSAATTSTGRLSNNVPAGTTTSNVGSGGVTPFRMKFKPQRTRKRKLGQSGTFGSSSSSSGSSSSEEDNDEEQQQHPQQTAAHHAHPHHHSPHHHHHYHAGEVAPGNNSGNWSAGGSAPSSSSNTNNSGSSGGDGNLSQPEGWRVKLYRLNADGSWDDCGTGRILCLYRQQKQQSGSSNHHHHHHHGNSERSTDDATQTAKSPAGPSSAKPPSSSHSGAGSISGGSGALTPGSDQWLYQETGEATLCVHAEVTKQNRQPRVLLRTRILLRDAYQRQGDNIITWCEPYYGQQQNQQEGSQDENGTNSANDNGGSSGVDLALSFQDNAGCLDIWRQITQTQQCAAELMRQQLPDQMSHVGGENNTAVEDMANRVAAEHHSDLQRQQQQELWANLTEEGRHHNGNNGGGDGDVHFGSGGMMDQAMVQLPNPPTMQNLEEIADTIASLQHTQQHAQQRENLAMWIAKDECLYLKQLLSLFPAAESKGDYGKLATLAACVKTVLLMNDPSILELIVTNCGIFEEICSCLEYDPDLREKANHRWFLRERAKFRTVVPMEDPELVSAIHRSFRVNYLRDTLLRPTMDESALSTLSSLQTFTHADVVKGVMMSGSGKEVDLKDSYLVRVIRMLGVEVHTLSILEWAELESQPLEALDVQQQPRDEFAATDPSIVVGKHSLDTATWKQYLAPQDRSLSSRRIRKRGCLSFLRELFNMVRLSLQQCDKDNFFAVICNLAIDLNEDREIPDNASQTSQIVEVGSVASTVKSVGVDEKLDLPHGGLEVTLPNSPVTLLSLLGSVLSDPNADVTEKGCVLEIVSGIAMHDPSLIRHCCLKFHESWKKEQAASRPLGGSISSRPEPNEKKQIIFFCPPNDLLASLLFLLDVETDAGVLLQVSEILRIILDTDMMGDHGSMSAGFADEAEGIPPGSGQTPLHDQHNQPSGVAATSTDQKQFLSLFYEHYVSWLVAPFQFSILHPTRRVPGSVLLSPSDSPLMQRTMTIFNRGAPQGNAFLKSVPSCAIRSSFAVELLSFCVRAHLYRMKFFLLKSRVLGSVLKLLRPRQNNSVSGDRCLKLAALRFLRAILSVNDEFYHRHIIQHNLFAPVFEAFRANPVGDNLVSSAIVEMCDYIHSENIKSLLEYIVTKHLSATHPENPSLEDVSSPYVSTLTILRKAYEENLKEQHHHGGVGTLPNAPLSPGGGSRYFGGSVHQMSSAPRLSGKALEDQRKFRAADQEESYFDSDDNDIAMESGSAVDSPSVAIDEMGAQRLDKDFNRTPPLFAFAQNPILGQKQEAVDTATRSDENLDGHSEQLKP